MLHCEPEDLAGLILDTMAERLVEVGFSCKEAEDGMAALPAEFAAGLDGETMAAIGLIPNRRMSMATRRGAPSHGAKVRACGGL